MSLKQRIIMKELNIGLLKQVCLVGWFLDSPSHWSTQTLLLPTSSVTFWSTVGRAKCDAQSRQIPLWDGLNLQALWCSMFPLVSSALCLFFFALLLSVFNPPLWVHCSTSLSLDSTNSPFVFCLCSWLLAIRTHACSVPLPPPSNHLLQLHLEFPV